VTETLAFWSETDQQASRTGHRIKKTIEISSQKFGQQQIPPIFQKQLPSKSQTSQEIDY